MTQQPLPPDHDIFDHVITLMWIPFSNSDPLSAYEEISKQGSIKRIFILIVAVNIVVLFGLSVLTFNMVFAPPIASAVTYLPFSIIYILLHLFLFLGSALIQLLCFRIFSGKGNLVPQSYLISLFVTNFLFLYIISMIGLIITRQTSIPSYIIFGGGLYLMYPYTISLQAIHKLPFWDCIKGIGLSIIVSVPLYLIYLYFLGFFVEARPYKFSDWVFWFNFATVVFAIFFVTSYMYSEQKNINLYPDGVPISVPFQDIKQFATRLRKK